MCQDSHGLKWQELEKQVDVFVEVQLGTYGMLPGSRHFVFHDIDQFPPLGININLYARERREIV
jgi:hypothetical protein